MIEASGPIVVLGASHAGVSMAAELRSAGCDRQIILVGEEDVLPYQRPDLSKGCLEGEMPEPRPLRPEAFFIDRSIERHFGHEATSIDRSEKVLIFADGSSLAYGDLVIATGASPRGLPDAMPGAARALTLRHRGDWRHLADRLANVQSLAVIGGGLIGLEVAAAIRSRGLYVTVIETAPRLMSRTLYPALAVEALNRHRAAGIDVRLAVALEAINACTVRLSDGAVVPADLVLAAVGSKPRDELATAAGLETRGGIVVDECGATADPGIRAIGDCAVWGEGPSAIRHESVAATVWQARCVSAALTGGEPPPASAFRLWSNQGTLRFQMSGPVSSNIRCEVTSVGEGMLLHGYAGEELVAVQALNAMRPFNTEVAKIGQRRPQLEQAGQAVVQPHA